MERQTVWTRQEEEDALKEKLRAEWIAEEEAMKKSKEEEEEEQETEEEEDALVLAHNYPCAHFIP